MRSLSIHRRTGEHVLQPRELLEHELVVAEVVLYADLADVLPKRFLRHEVGKDPLPRMNYQTIYFVLMVPEAIDNFLIVIARSFRRGYDDRRWAG